MFSPMPSQEFILEVNGTSSGLHPDKAEERPRHSGISQGVRRRYTIGELWQADAPMHRQPGSTAVARQEDNGFIKQLLLEKMNLTLC